MTYSLSEYQMLQKENNSICKFFDTFDAFKEPLIKIEGKKKEIKVEHVSQNYQNTCE